MLTNKEKKELWARLVERKVLIENPMDPEKLFLNEKYIEALDVVYDSVTSMAAEDTTPENLLTGLGTAGYMYWKKVADVDEINEACLALVIIYQTHTDKRLNEWAMKLRLRGKK